MHLITWTSFQRCNFQFISDEERWQRFQGFWICEFARYSDNQTIHFKCNRDNALNMGCTWHFRIEITSKSVNWGGRCNLLLLNKPKFIRSCTKVSSKAVNASFVYLRKTTLEGFQILTYRKMHGHFGTEIQPMYSTNQLLGHQFDWAEINWFSDNICYQIECSKLVIFYRKLLLMLLHEWFQAVGQLIVISVQFF